MKKAVAVFLFILLIATSVFAQRAFFPTTEGQVLVYANLDKKGKVTGYTQQTIKSVTGSGNNLKITYATQEMDKDKNPLGGEVELVVTITDGVVEVDLKSLAAPGTAGN